MDMEPKHAAILAGALVGGAWALTRRGPLGIEFAAPLRNSFVSSGWGDSRSHRTEAGTNEPGIHRGLDFPAPVGTWVYSVIGGTVTHVDAIDNSNEGRNVRVSGAGVTARFLHLDKVFVTRRQSVYPGMPIGTIGRTGILRSGPHLHLDIWLDGSKLAEFKRVFGNPSPSISGGRSFGTQVPAESLVPVHTLADRVIANASARNVHIRSL